MLARSDCMLPRIAGPVRIPRAQNSPQDHTFSSAERLWHEQGPVAGQGTAPGAPPVVRPGTERSPNHFSTAFPVAHPGSQESDDPATLPFGLRSPLAVSVRHAIVLTTRPHELPHDRPLSHYGQRGF